MPSINPKDWASLLYEFGPFALLLFFSIVTLGAARKELGAHPHSKMHQRIYLGNWVAIFTLAAGAAAVWIMLNIYMRPVIQGEIRTLQGSEVVQPLGEDCYLHRRLIDNQGRFTIQWLLLGERKLQAGTKVAFLFSDNAETNVKEIDLELEVQDTFYKAPVNLIYRRQEGRFFLEHLGKVTEIGMRTETVAAGSGPRQRGFFESRTVFAQAKLDEQNFVQRLQSIDPVIRRDARLQMAKVGADALPFIDRTLSNSNSSYQLQLGSLSALNSMAEVPVNSLSVTSLAYILRKIGTQDDTLRKEARKFIQARASWEMEAKIDQARIALMKQPPGAGEARKQLSALSLAQMDLLYNLGVREEDRYVKHQSADLTKAFGAFEKGWSLRQNAEPGMRIYFAKALYGWALTLAERAVLEVDANRSKKPEFVAQAQAKFKEFLQAAQAPGGATYPSPEHIKIAGDYVANPILRSSDRQE
jgi:hypothetical protein